MSSDPQDSGKTVLTYTPPHLSRFWVLYSTENPTWRELKALHFTVACWLRPLERVPPGAAI